MDTVRQEDLLWRIELFGGPRANRGTHTLERFPTQKTAGLFAILAYFPGRHHSRERLVDVLWPEAEPASGRDRLSQALVWLRPRLEPDGTPRGSILQADRAGVSLVSEALTTDVNRFEAALAAAVQAKDDPRRCDALEEAVSLYKGDLLPSIYSDWVFPERQRHLNACLLALSRLSRLYEAAGDHTRALGCARRALAADPLQEEAHRDLIRLLASAGQHAAALLHFQEMKNLLLRELDAEPSAETLALVGQIKRGTYPSPAPAVRSPLLPIPLTRFFGREEEIARVCRMVRQDGTRLVTLLGIGGAGKTRLGLAVAADLREPYAGAVAFIPLSDLHDARRIPGAIAQAMHLPAIGPDPSLDQVAEALRGRRSLLVLDNLEHLLPEAASVIRALLERAPLLIVLATSRQRLGIEGEQEMLILPLPVPEPAATSEQIQTAPSVQLFVDRARAVRPDFTLTETNAETVAQICARLEGIPLAIELCAAWAQTLTPAQMLLQLARRFDLLISRRTDITPRHRTLRAALEYSYLLLPSPLKLLFGGLSVFRGGWSLEAAQAVCVNEEVEDPLPLLAALTELRERSLIVAEESMAGGLAEMRYRFLDTLREFAGSQMTYADRPERRRQHLAYFLAQAEAETEGPERERWLTRMAREQENLRTALAVSLEDGALSLGLRLGTALSRYWTVRGPLREGCDWLRRLLDQSEAGPILPASVLSVSVRANAWSALGQLTWARGDYPAAQAAHEQALLLRRQIGEGVAESLYHLGITAYRRDLYPAAQSYLEESLALARVDDDRAGVARVLLNLGNLAYEQQDHATADDLFQQSLALEQELGNRPRIASGYNNLAMIATAAQDFLRASTLLNQALTIRRELTDHVGATTTLAGLGSIARLQGQLGEAAALLREGLTLAREVGDRHVTAIFLMEFGLLAVAEGNLVRAVPLLAASEQLFTKIGSSPGGAIMGQYRLAIAAVRDSLEREHWDTLWSQGRTTPPEQIVTELLEK